MKRNLAFLACFGFLMAMAVAIAPLAVHPQGGRVTVIHHVGTTTPTPTPTPTPFVPTDIAGLKLWLKADSLALSDNDPVGTWADQSGNGNDAAQTDAAAKPTYKTGIQNSLPIVRFDGTNDNLGLPDFMTGSAAGHVFVVIRIVTDPPGAEAQTGLWVFGSDTQSTHYPYTDGTIYDSFGTTARKSTVNPTPSLSSTFRIYSVASGSGEWTSWLDGSQLFTTASNTVGWSTTPIIGQSFSAVRLQGDIAEFIVYDSILSTVNRQKVEAYLTTRWGL